MRRTQDHVRLQPQSGQTQSWIVRLSSPVDSLELEIPPAGLIFGAFRGDGTPMDCDGVPFVAVEDEAVSRRHVKVGLVRRGDEGFGLEVEDLQSRNGTWLSGVRIRQVTLEPGSCVVFGQSILSFEAPDTSQTNVDSGRWAGGATVPGAIGSSRVMQRLATQVRAYAGLSAGVLVRGESGSGKEVVARALHELSPRARGPFLALNLGALPRELAEAELFGAERGAYTGAAQARAGIFELAHTGTLLLDELGELPMDMQAKLLRVLETREVRRLGGTTTRTVDVRVVAATWAPLEDRILEGRFREDLFHRVAVLVIDVPALRERIADVPLLAQYLLKRHRDEFGARTFSGPALSRLSGEPWAGNVRELANVVYRAAASTQTPVIGLEDVVKALGRSFRSEPPARPAQPVVAASRRIRNTSSRKRLRDLDPSGLLEEHGSIAAAARALELPRETVRDWLRRETRCNSQDCTNPPQGT